jgi:hypothetical protein
VVLWANGKQQSKAQTGADGLATLAMAGPAPPPDANGNVPEPENVWIFAHHGGEPALVTPWSYGFSSTQSGDWKSYIYTDRPVYRPGHTVHIKAVLRKEAHDALTLPDAKTMKLKVTDADNKVVFQQDLPISAHGTVTTDLNLAADAGLGYYTINLDAVQGGDGSFYVEEYKKPEYQVTVKPSAARVLQGNSIQAVIEARYFFGEPVANAKVKYVVHTTQHYWWDQDEDDAAGGDSASDASADADSDSDDTYGATEQQEH